MKGQSAAVAAQYMPSGQQYHPTLGQHPPGHSVPSHCSVLVNLTLEALATARNARAIRNFIVYEVFPTTELTKCSQGFIDYKTCKDKLLTYMLSQF